MSRVIHSHIGYRRNTPPNVDWIIVIVGVLIGIVFLYGPVQIGEYATNFILWLETHFGKIVEITGAVIIIITLSYVLDRLISSGRRWYNNDDD